MAICAPPPDVTPARALSLLRGREAAAQGSSIRGLDCSCFDGKYVTSKDGKYDDYLESLAVTRSDSRNSGNESNPLHYVDRLESSPDERKAGGRSPPKLAASK